MTVLSYAIIRLSPNTVIPLSRYISFYIIATLILARGIFTYGISDLITNITAVAANIFFIINRFYVLRFDLDANSSFFVRSAEGTGPEWLKHESLGYCPIGLASFWTLLIDSIAYAPYIVLNQASYTLLF